MSDEEKTRWTDWIWLVSAFQGQAIAMRANVKSWLEGMPWSPKSLPEYFEYCHFTNIIFRPPDNFAFMPWSVEMFGLIEEVGWMGRDQLPFLRQPTAPLIAQLDRAWSPPAEEPAVKPATEADIKGAAQAHKAKEQLVEKLKLVT